MITHARLLELLHYDKSSGVFTWRRTSRHLGLSHQGRRAGTRIHHDYVAIKLHARSYLAHRLAWFYVTGCWPLKEIDHINGLRYDNAFANLREADRSINGQNRRRADRDSLTGVLGVTPLPKGRYRAQIVIAGRTKNLGHFDTTREAHAAYLDAKRRLHEGCTI